MIDKIKILITGGAGFIPSALAEKLAENSENYIVIVDSLLTGSLEKVPVSKHNNIKFIKCDVNEFRDISRLHSPLRQSQLCAFSSSPPHFRFACDPLQSNENVSFQQSRVV